MARFRLTKAAEADLQAIAQYTVEHFGAEKAAHLAAEFRRAFQSLADRPRKARLRTEINPPVRTWVNQAHIILFDIVGEKEILIVRVRHSREDWTAEPPQ